MNLDVNKKIEGIMQSSALDDLSLKFLPPVSDSPDNYYFISYSHKDYKAVYPDIYALQAEGVNVWYDRAMPAGESWKETAEKYIRPSRCAGVVFYVSENSLLSPAIHEEIAFAKQCGKSCLTINLPTSDGKSHSAKEMLDAMRASGVEISVDKYKFIADSFNDEVLYLPYSQSAEQKAEKILKLQKPPILNMAVWGAERVVESVNDIEIRKLVPNDFAYVDENGETKYACFIGECAFANCRNLESVELPPSVFCIRKYAFYCCRSLKTINLDNVNFLEEYAFHGCNSLNHVTLGKELKSIGDYAFAGCNFTEIDIPQSVEKIGNRAFSYSRLKSVVIPDSVTEMGEGVFEHCDDLTKCSIGNGLSSLDLAIFKECYAVQELTIGKNATQLDNPQFIGTFQKFKKLTINKENNTYRLVNNCLIDIAAKKMLYATGDAVIPSDGSVTVLSSSALDNHYGFKDDKLYIPACIETIDETHLFNCFKEIVVEEGNKRYHSAGNCLIETSKRKIILGCENSVIPSDGSVTVIGRQAFSFVSNLDYIEIPYCIEEIEEEAFINSHIVQLVIHGSGLKKVGENAFFCGGLKWLDIFDLNNYLQVDFEGIYASPSHDVKLYVNNEPLETFIINDDTPEINEFALWECISIKKLAVLKFFSSEVSLKAFAQCTRIKEILIPEGVTVTDIDELPKRMVKKIKYLSFMDISAELY